MMMLFFHPYSLGSSSLGAICYSRAGQVHIQAGELASMVNTKVFREVVRKDKNSGAPTIELIEVELLRDNRCSFVGKGDSGKEGQMSFKFFHKRQEFHKFWSVNHLAPPKTFRCLDCLTQHEIVLHNCVDFVVPPMPPPSTMVYVKEMLNITKPKRCSRCTYYGICTDKFPWATMAIKKNGRIFLKSRPIWTLGQKDCGKEWTEYSTSMYPSMAYKIVSERFVRNPKGFLDLFPGGHRGGVLTQEKIMKFLPSMYKKFGEENGSCG